MKVVYLAYDGTQFEDKDECEEYEQQLSIIRGLDDEGEEIPFLDEDFCEFIETIYLATEKAVQIFKERCYAEAFKEFAEGIDSPGTYLWITRDESGNNCYRWKPIKEAIACYQKRASQLEERMNKLLKK